MRLLGPLQTEKQAQQTENQRQEIKAIPAFIGLHLIGNPLRPLYSETLGVNEIYSAKPISVAHMPPCP